MLALRSCIAMLCLCALVRAYNTTDNIWIEKGEDAKELKANLIEDVIVRSPDDLTWDDADHLAKYYLFYPASSICKSFVEAAWQMDKNYIRILRPLDINSDFARSLLSHNRDVLEAFHKREVCMVMTLSKGTPRKMIGYLQEQASGTDTLHITLIKKMDPDQALKELDEWIQLHAQQVEVAITNHVKGECVVYYGQNLKSGVVRPELITSVYEIHPGEQISVTTKLGARLRVVLPYVFTHMYHE